ncbi:set-domain histone methyltransferase-8 [Colletotrichum costaricense]|uniref:Set-domain histone methyltransferase-8 n=1 Tax=Colletotrichum costaricense TaxID=1209916 RepID=A0AAI9YVT5_9PEZI|nr:set-domain histone methyltransferase-8 [Colletotrichum costaricense]KAK1526067.1 set-domain histone methyltransferase-8 [Colletotrichum costaricense]
MQQAQRDERHRRARRPLENFPTEYVMPETLCKVTDLFLIYEARPEVASSDTQQEASRPLRRVPYGPTISNASLVVLLSIREKVDEILQSGIPNGPSTDSSVVGAIPRTTHNTRVGRENGIRQNHSTSAFDFTGGPPRTLSSETLPTRESKKDSVSPRRGSHRGARPDQYPLLLEDQDCSSLKQSRTIPLLTDKEVRDRLSQNNTDSLCEVALKPHLPLPHTADKGPLGSVAQPPVFPCVVADLGQRTARTLGLLAQEKTVRQSGFIKIKVSDYRVPDRTEMTVTAIAPIDSYTTTRSETLKDGTNRIEYHNTGRVKEGDSRTMGGSRGLGVSTDFGSAFRRETVADLSQKTYLVGNLSAFEGLDPGYLDCGVQLRAILRENVDGVSSPYLYCAIDPLTTTTMHIEDLRSASVNMVRWGGPKAWLIVEPGSSRRLEERIAKACGVATGTRTSCSQFVRHLNRIIPSETLDHWNIKYNIVDCYAGELIATMPDTYHQVINRGVNIAEAVNVAWSPIAELLTDYRFCSSRCAGDSGITKRHLDPEKAQALLGNGSDGGSVFRPLDVGISPPAPLSREKGASAGGNTHIQARLHGQKLSARRQKPESRIDQGAASTSQRKRASPCTGSFSPPAEGPAKACKRQRIEARALEIDAIAEGVLDGHGAQRCIKILEAWRCSSADALSMFILPRSPGQSQTGHSSILIQQHEAFKAKSELSTFQSHMALIMLHLHNNAQDNGRQRRSKEAVDKLVITYASKSAEGHSRRKSMRRYLAWGQAYYRLSCPDLGFLAALPSKNALRDASEHHIERLHKRLASRPTVSTILREFGSAFADLVRGGRDLCFEYDREAAGASERVASIEDPQRLLELLRIVKIEWNQESLSKDHVTSGQLPCYVCGQNSHCPCFQDWSRKQHPSLRIFKSDGSKKPSIYLRAFLLGNHRNPEAESIVLREGDTIALLPGNLVSQELSSPTDWTSAQPTVSLCQGFAIKVDMDHLYMKLPTSYGTSRNVTVRIALVSGLRRALLVASRNIRNGEIVGMERPDVPLKLPNPHATISSP